MNKFFAALRRALGNAAVPAQAAGAVSATAPTVESMDADGLLFSTPTLASDAPPVEPLDDQAPRHGLAMHEDDWRQLELRPATQLAEVQQLLSDIQVFEAAQREGSGWRELYRRDLGLSAVLPPTVGIEELAALLAADVEPAPLICSTYQVLGCLQHGFTLALGGQVTLYGQLEAGGITVLGVTLGEEADPARLVQAFAVLNAGYGLLLIDWQQQQMLVEQREDGTLSVWQP